MDRYIRDEILEKQPQVVDNMHTNQESHRTQLWMIINRLISKSIEDKEIAMATFLAIERAFNHVSIDSLVGAQSRRRAPPNFCRWIRAGLEKRKITSTLDDRSVVAKAGGGTPQGGILSPPL